MKSAFHVYSLMVGRKVKAKDGRNWPQMSKDCAETLGSSQLTKNSSEAIWRASRAPDL